MTSTFDLIPPCPQCGADTLFVVSDGIFQCTDTGCGYRFESLEDEDRREEALRELNKDKGGNHAT